MSILDVENLYFKYDEPLYENLNLRIFKGEHICLVGPNGSGKSTLLKLIDQRLKPDKGLIKWQNNILVGYMDQYLQLDKKLIVKDYLNEAFSELFKLEEQMEEYYINASKTKDNEQANYLNWANSIQERLLDSDFYQIKSTISNIINGLGLEMNVLNKSFKELSDGMRAKIILGKLLLSNSDVLLLDEPTNFLDIAHIEWLTKFLNNYDKTFVVVSHHEGFIKDIAKTVFAIENKSISRYKGNYEFYLKERTIKFETQEKAYINQQKYIKATKDFIGKNIVRASTTKRAQSRRKMLEKLEVIHKPLKNKKYHFSFPFNVQTGLEVIKLEELEVGYDYSLLEPLSLIIRKEEKVAITGKNGIGKTTVLKTILDLIPKIAGNFEWIDTVNISYFSQDDDFSENDTPFEIVHHKYPHFSKKEVMDLLGNHGISYDLATREIKTLSGGEKAKTKLALLRHNKGNVLILDEPTNHLDQAAKKALKEALIEYKGTLIIVSHEKAFYEEVCDYEINLYN